MKFGHIGDCHLGGWRQPELMDLNSQSFHYAIDFCIKEKVDFMLVAGDLFDNAYPPIEALKEAFSGFKKLKERNIPVFIIAGSHDYSASGKTFLDVLEKAGFCQNVFQPEERGESIMLHPTIYKNVAIYGYPGKKTGMEVQEIARINIQDAPGLFKILMLHTAIRDAVGSLPIPAVNQDKLPKVDYLALAHLHVRYNKNGRVYCGPTFPNNSTELEELKRGSFYIVDTKGKIDRHEIKLKDVLVKEIQISDAITATDNIILELSKENLSDKIIILKVHGIIESGSISDIRFDKVDSYVKSKGAYVLLKSISNLFAQESNMDLELESENIEEEIIKRFQQENKSDFNKIIFPLFSILQLEKKEEEKTQNFEDRLFNEITKVVDI